MSFVQLGSDIDGEAARDLSGYGVSLSADGNTVAIGAPKHDETAEDNRGHVRVYELNGSTWQQKGNDIDGEAAGDNSGHSVSLSADGNTVAIGAPYNDGNGSNSGHVRVYDYVGGVWVQKGGDIDGEAEDDYSALGVSISLSGDGNIVAIGASGNDGDGSDSGHVRVYEYDDTQTTVSPIGWRKRGGDIDGEAENDKSGYSVSLSSNGLIVAIGAHLNDGDGSNSGHVRVYEWNGASWSQKGADIDGEASGDQSGFSVSLSADGETVAIGALYNDGDNGTMSGHVQVYDYDGSSWSQKGGDIDGEALADLSGYSVSLSGDGDVVAIGANANDGNGSASGHVRVYEYDDTQTTVSPIGWRKRGDDIDGEEARDESGRSVSLSADGNTVAIGATKNDGNGVSSGHVRVYTYSIPCLTETCNILTPNGYRNVSSLKSGDVVTTSDNRNVKIEKMFTSRVLASKMSPCVIKAHKYGKNKPMIDTHISENHAYQVGGLWKMPKNEKLCKEWNGKYINFYHIKLPDYSKDYLVVNGLTTEGWDGLLPGEFHPTKWVKEGNGLVLKKC